MVNISNTFLPVSVIDILNIVIILSIFSAGEHVRKLSSLLVVLVHLEFLSICVPRYKLLVLIQDIFHTSRHLAEQAYITSVRRFNILLYSFGNFSTILYRNSFNTFYSFFYISQNMFTSTSVRN